MARDERSRLRHGFLDLDVQRARVHLPVRSSSLFFRRRPLKLTEAEQHSGGAIPGFGSQIVWNSWQGIGAIALCNTVGFSPFDPLSQAVHY